MEFTQICLIMRISLVLEELGRIIFLHLGSLLRGTAILNLESQALQTWVKLDNRSMKRVRFPALY